MFNVQKSVDFSPLFVIITINESFNELSFSEIEFIKSGGMSMFYLYIDEVLVLQSVNFHEIYNFIFDFYYRRHQEFYEMKNEEGFLHHFEKFCDDIRNLIYGSLHGLILHQFDSFICRDHEVMIYYGYQKS